ncbi:MAG TPA: Gfo/Idh/MocA family oxidoreductase, partial [Firmicutes bacterium]|nr:Gfo/Idh/MocA family oxidoreductase [Bacillota bacterium]
LKFGIIGCRHGHVHSQITELLAIPGAICAGVYDDDDASVQSVLDRHPVSRIDSPDRLLDDPDVTLIGTAEVNRRKPDVILRALNAGKNAIADKPLCTSIEDLNAIEKTATEKGLRVGLQLTERFGPANRRMKSLVDSGAVGHVANVMCWRPHRLGRPGRPDWMFDDDQYGGILVDLAIHDADIIRWLCGGVFTEITAYEQNFGNPSDTDFHDIGTLLGRLSTGPTGFVRTDWFTPTPSPVHGDTRFLVTGTEGMIEVRTAGDLWAKKPDTSGQILVMTNTDGVKVEKPEPPSKTLVQDFVDSIREGTTPDIMNRDVFEATRATLMARMSSKLSRTVLRGETLAT